MYKFFQRIERMDTIQTIRVMCEFKVQQLLYLTAIKNT